MTAMEMPRQTWQLARLDDADHDEDDAPPSAWTRLRRIRLVMIVVLFALPVAGAVLYNFVIATPRFVSEFSFVVRSLDSPRDRFSVLNITQPSAGADNAEAVVNFIDSRDLLGAINRDGLVDRIFAAPGLDPLAAFPSLLRGTTQEDRFRQFSRYVNAKFNRATNITQVEVQAFTPREALVVAQRILETSEAKVNQLNRRARRNLVAGAEQDVLDGSTNLAQVLQRLEQVRSRSRVLEPRLEAGASIKVSSATAAQLAAIQVQLAQTLRVAPGSPLIGQLRARRDSLAGELARQGGAAAGTKGSLAERMRGYEALDAERDVAEKRLAAASLALVSARGSADRQQLYIERISQPNLSDEAYYPRAWHNLLLTVLISAGIAWIAVSLCEVVFGDD